MWLTLGGSAGETWGTNAIYIRPSQLPDNSSWMGDLLKRKPDVRLNELTMAGSHDAGMWMGNNEWAKTQRMSILDQLKAGSRYFDIRTSMWGSEVWTYHGSAWGDKLENILSNVETFLSSAAGQNEVVILKFSHAYANSRQATVDLIGNFNQQYLYKAGQTNPATMRLKDLKGNVVAVFGDDNVSFQGWWASRCGILPYHDIAEDASPPIQVQPDGLTVYDRYADKGAYEQMVADQNPKLSKYGGWGHSYLFLLSWTLTGGGAVSDIEVLASMANPWLPRKLQEVESIISSARPNIVYLDFIDAYICGAILEVNRHPL